MSMTQTTFSDDDDDELLEDEALWPDARLVRGEGAACCIA